MVYTIKEEQYLQINTGNILYFPESGDINSSGSYSSYSCGYYWNSTAYNSERGINDHAAFRLRFWKDGDLNNKNVIMNDGLSRNNGAAVRCVKK